MKLHESSVDDDDCNILDDEDESFYWGVSVAGVNGEECSFKGFKGGAPASLHIKPLISHCDILSYNTFTELCYTITFSKSVHFQQYVTLQKKDYNITGGPQTSSVLYNV